MLYFYVPVLAVLICDPIEDDYSDFAQLTAYGPADATATHYLLLQ